MTEASKPHSTQALVERIRERMWQSPSSDSVADIESLIEQLETTRAALQDELDNWNPERRPTLVEALRPFASVTLTERQEQSEHLSWQVPIAWIKAAQAALDVPYPAKERP